MISTGKIAITGARGQIGSVLSGGLSEYAITRLSYPFVDVRNFNRLNRAFRNHFMAIHLAWNKKETQHSINSCADNTAMIINVYRAALENGLKRLIMASSVHTDDFHGWTAKELITVDGPAKPVSVYGAHKLFMESLGRLYAKKGVEVVCIRFGGINAENIPNRFTAGERAVFLHTEDCLDLVRAVLDAPEVPGGFSIVYAVSDTQYRIHDITNPFGWKPPFRTLES